MTRFATRLMSQRARRVLDERGVTMIIFGLLITGLLVIVAIVIDLGNARQQKRQLQNSADAAALAGASVINANTATCTGGDQLNDALKYAYNNLTVSGSAPSCPTSGIQYTTGNTTVTVLSPYNAGPPAFDPTSLVNVKICRDVGTTFGKIINVQSIHVCSNATARKAGVGTPGNPNDGTTPSDPDAPCTEDNFIPTKYQPGGSPGGKVADGNTIGALFGVTPVADAATLDLVNHPPTITLNGVAVSPSSTNPIKINGKNYTGAGFVLPAAMGNQTVNGVTYHNVYNIQWHISDPVTGASLPNNASYSISMSAYDTDQDHSPSGDCGKAQWSFVKGTLPSGGTSPCTPGSSGQVEDSFLGTIFPQPGVVVHKGDMVGATFQDESIVYNGQTAGDPHKIVFQIDGADIPQGTLGTPATQGPNTVELPGSTTAVYTLHSPSALITPKEKYSTDIQYKLPLTLSPGSHTVTLKAWDTDSNKAGGDCGTATWTINLAGSDVELVQ